MSESPSRSLAATATAGHDTSSSFALLIRAQNGDEAARNELCARYLPRLRQWAHGRLPDWARDHLDTEDIVQDTLMRSVRRLDGFTPEHDRAFCAYLCEALRNRLRDAVRRATRRPPGAPLELAVGEQTMRRYEAALNRLREPDRELIVGRVELGLEYAELATLMNKPSLTATRVAVSRALIRLAAEMGVER